MKHFSEQRIRNLPEPIERRLGEIIARVRRIQLLKGTLATLAAAMIGVLVVMGIDTAFVVESKTIRLVLSLAVLAITLLVVWAFLVRPLKRPISLAGVARWVETHHPEMQERISTAIELLGHPNDAGSAQLLGAVVDDAITDVNTLNPRQELSGKLARRPAITALSAAGVMIVLVVFWAPAWRMISRVISPLADIGNAYADQIRVLTISRTMAAGDALQVEAAINGTPDRVELRMMFEDGRTSVESLAVDPTISMQKGEVGYALHLPTVFESFTGRIVAGKALSQAFVITVLKRPVIDGLTMTYEFPAYTGRQPQMISDFIGDITAVAGTKITLRGKSTRPLSHAGVMMEDRLMEGVRTDIDGEFHMIEWVMTLPPQIDTTWHFEIADDAGIKNHPIDYKIKSQRDSPPEIVIHSPQESEFELQPTEKFPLEFTVTEDFGIGSVRLLVRPSGLPEKELKVDPLPLRNDKMMNEWLGAMVLDLNAMELKNAEEIRINLVVEDRLPMDAGGPQSGRSREILVRLRQNAKSLLEQTFAAQGEELQKQIAEARKMIEEAKARMDEKPRQLENEIAIHPSILNEIEESARFARQAGELLTDVSERMENTAYRRQSSDLKSIAQQFLAPSAVAIEEIPFTATPQERKTLAEKAKGYLEKALQTLQDEQNQLLSEQEQADQIAQLSALAEKEKELAEAARKQKQANAKKATDAARELADKAKELLAKQEELSRKAAVDEPPEEQSKLAEAEQKLEVEAGEFQNLADHFRRENEGEINQYASQRQQLEQAKQDAAQGGQDARQAAELAREAAAQNQQTRQMIPKSNIDRGNQIVQQAENISGKANELARNDEDRAYRASDADSRQKEEALIQAGRNMIQQTQQLQEQLLQFQIQNVGELEMDAVDFIAVEQAVQDMQQAVQNTEQSQIFADDAVQQDHHQRDGDHQSAGKDEAMAASREGSAAQAALEEVAQNMTKLIANVKNRVRQPLAPDSRLLGSDKWMASLDQVEASRRSFADAVTGLELLVSQLAKNADMDPSPAPLAKSQSTQEEANQVAQEAQQKWDSEQAHVAEQARNMSHRAQAKNPKGMELSLIEAAAKARDLALKSTALAKQQQGVGQDMGAVTTMEGRTTAAGGQKSVADLIAMLQKQAVEFHEKAALQINQSTGSQEANNKAQAGLHHAVQQSAASVEEISATENVVAPLPGVKLADAAKTSLEKAASAFAALGSGLQQQAMTTAKHAQSLQEGAKQADMAAQQGRQSSQQSMKAAAKSAGQAAENLANAAASAIEEMGIPKSAMKPQTSSNSRSKGKGKGQDGAGRQQGGEGDKAQAGPQEDGVSQAMPPELAKLGLTQSDWMKMKSVIGGTGSADGERVPEEYRELVRAYFGAMANSSDQNQNKEEQRK